MRVSAALLAAVLVLPAATPSRAASVAGAGATFPQPLYQRWAEAYAKATGNQVTYKGTGSGDGVQQVEQGSVDFGASDVPLASGDVPQRPEGSGVVEQFPAVVGGIVPVVNLDGVSPGDLVLDGPTLSQLLQGTIRRWDDPAIARLNPNLPLPPIAVKVVHRSDPSGTTYNLSGFLRATGAGWHRPSADLPWPVGAGVAGSDAMVQAVRSTEGAVGYVEYAYAKRANLTYANMVNADGKTVQPTPSSFAAASAHTDWTRDPPSPVNAKGGASWPITAVTFVLVRRPGPGKRATASSVLAFFRWAWAKGGSMAEDLDYVPLPADVAKAIDPLGEGRRLR